MSIYLKLYIKSVMGEKAQIGRFHLGIFCIFIPGSCSDRQQKHRWNDNDCMAVADQITYQAYNDEQHYFE